MRSFNVRLLAIVTGCISLPMALQAQYVYKIKADTVKIYNTCDTAELVLQNRTQNVSGFLYNKGKGVTEFRPVDWSTITNIPAGGVAPSSGSSYYIQNQNAGNQTASFAINGNGTIGGGMLTLNNATSNYLNLAANGVGVPTFTTRSPGTKVVLFPTVNATNADYAIGMDYGFVWFSVQNNTAANGFKFYGATTQVGRIDGVGGSEWAGQGRFKGWYSSGTGPAAEIGYTGTSAIFSGYDRTVGATKYVPVTLVGGANSVSKTLFIDGTGYQLSDLKNASLLGTDASGYLVDKGTSFAPSTAGTGYIQNQNLVQQTADFQITGQGLAKVFIAYSTAVGGGSGVALQEASNRKYWVNSYNSTLLIGGAGSSAPTTAPITVINSGNVGIGTNTPAYTLDVSGTIQATGFYQASLRSLKRDIQPFNKSSIDILSAVKVRTFIYKADTTNTTHIGFIADEVPDEMASPGRKGVDQANTTALLVKALQEVTAKMEALEKKVTDLQKQLDESKK